MPNEIDYRKLAQAALDLAATNKAVSTTPGYVMPYGPGGLFATPGLSRPLFSALQFPIYGLQNRLPVYMSNEMSPLFEVITGVGTATGTHPVGVCDPAKTAGLMSAGTHFATFGRFAMQTPVINLEEMGQRVNRAVFTDLKLMNQPQLNGMLPTLPGNANLANSLTNELNKVFVEFGIGWAREFGRQIWTGTPVNNTAQKGYMEFYGLESLVNTNRKDALTGALLPALNSLYYNFASANITGNATNATNLVNKIIGMYRRLKTRAKKTGLAPAKIIICMTEALFYEITAFWPCIYKTNQCAGVITDANVQIVVTGDSNVTDRDAMRGDLENRTGQYLLIDGQKVEVQLDDALPEESIGGGVYESNIFFLPLTVLGTVPVLYMDAYDYNQGGGFEAAQILAPNGTFSVTDGGRFFWAKQMPSAFCVQSLAVARTRLMLLTPFLSGRIDNVDYTPGDVIDSPWPGDPNYTQGGGFEFAPESWFQYNAPV